MEYVLDYWFVTIPVALGGAWFASAWIIWGPILGRQMAKDARAAGLDPDHDDLQEWRAGTRWRWVRIFEIALITYHFPVVLPTAWISRNDSGPRLIFLIPLQAAVYIGVLWGISLLIN